MALQNFSIKTGRRVSGSLEDGLGEPLLIDAKAGQDEDGEDNDDNDDDPEESRRPATSLAAAYRLLTPSVKVPYLTIFFSVVLLAMPFTIIDARCSVTPASQCFLCISLRLFSKLIRFSY